MHHGDISIEIAQGLLALQQRIKAAGIPPSQLDETLNIATWNIREFGKKPRNRAAIHYIAEILGQFDLIGLVELRDHLTDLGRVPEDTGPTGRAVYSDMIPDAGGNRERVATSTISVPSPLTASPQGPTNRVKERLQVSA